jgi:NADH-quinone oxidoreductase subunit E
LKGTGVDDHIETREEKKFAFSDENEAIFQETLAKYPTKMAVLLPALWLCQNQGGYLTDDMLEYVAERLDLSPVHVYSVVEFYTMYHRRPPGKYHLQLCRTLSCVLCGCEEIRDHIRKKLGIQPGEKTKDGLFSIEEVECLGSCGTSPVMRINDVYCENLTLAKVDEILETCKSGGELEEEPMGKH